MSVRTLEQELRYTWLSISKMYNEEASKFGATMATAFTLLSIDPKKGTSSTSLGPKMGMESTSLSRILKSLEERKLIKRNPNPSRSVKVKLFCHQTKSCARGIILHEIVDNGFLVHNLRKVLILKFRKKK